MSIELCGVTFKKEIGVYISNRFTKKDINEIIINNERVLFDGDYA